MKLAPYIVGYLDLLGFSDAVLREEEEPTRLMGRSLTFSALKAACKERTDNVLGRRVETRWLSDTCVFAALITELTTTDIVEALHDTSTAVGIVQCTFASEHYFSRGGIAIGRMLQTANADGSHGPALHAELFGAGLVRAAEIERSVARHPRVAVSARLAAPALTLVTGCSRRSIFLRDIELPYVDYLSFAEIISPEGPERVIAAHAELVHNLIVHSGRLPVLRRKAAWLLEYHNAHVASRGAIDHLTIRIAIPETDSDPERPQLEGLPALRLRPLALVPVESATRQIDWTQQPDPEKK